MTMTKRYPFDPHDDGFRYPTDGLRLFRIKDALVSTRNDGYSQIVLSTEVVGPVDRGATTRVWIPLKKETDWKLKQWMAACEVKRDGFDPWDGMIVGREFIGKHFASIVENTTSMGKTFCNLEHPRALSSGEKAELTHEPQEVHESAQQWSDEDIPF